MSEKDTATVELTAPEFQEQKPEVKPTREELRGLGWTKEELDSAEKRGMVAKEEEKKAEPVEPKPETKAEPKVEEKQEEAAKETEKKPNGLPEFTFKTPEQEKAWLDAFGPGTPQRGLYFRMKNERRERQAIEAERDKLLREVEELKSKGQVAKKTEDDSMQSLLDDMENANGTPEEDKPLTMRQLKELEAKREKELKNQEARQIRLTEAHREQEEYARNVYPDFDDAVVRAKEVMQRIDEIVPEKWRQAKLRKLMVDLQVAAAKADELGLDDYNAAHIAYEIAGFHPEHGKPKAEKPEKANGGHTPEAMKRIEQNTQRRASSASVASGSGSRTVSVDDIGLKELNAMSSAERWSFREKHPDRYERIVRG